MTQVTVRRAALTMTCALLHNLPDVPVVAQLLVDVLLPMVCVYVLVCLCIVCGCMCVCGCGCIYVRCVHDVCVVYMVYIVVG